MRTHRNTACHIEPDQARRRTRQPTVLLIPIAERTVQSFGVTYSSPPGKRVSAGPGGVFSRKARRSRQTVRKLAAQATRLVTQDAKGELVLRGQLPFVHGEPPLRRGTWRVGAGAGRLPHQHPPAYGRESVSRSATYTTHHRTGGSGNLLIPSLEASQRSWTARVFATASPKAAKSSTTWRGRWAGRKPAAR